LRRFPRVVRRAERSRPLTPDSGRESEAVESTVASQTPNAGGHSGTLRQAHHRRAAGRIVGTNPGLPTRCRPRMPNHRSTSAAAGSASSGGSGAGPITAAIASDILTHGIRAGDHVVVVDIGIAAVG